MSAPFAHRYARWCVSRMTEDAKRRFLSATSAALGVAQLRRTRRCRISATHALLADDLVDAMSIFTVPVALGGGKKLFADGSTPHYAGRG